MNNAAIQKRKNPQTSVPERMDQNITFTPHVDIVETNDEFIFQADLPGVRAGDVDVKYENGALTISGTVHPRQSDQINFEWQEYGVGNFFRQFTLDAPINADGIRAELKQGVLELRLPKTESAKTRKIQIKTT